MSNGLDLPEQETGISFICTNQKLMEDAFNSKPVKSLDGETVADFIFLGSKITAYGDCSHEIKRHLLLRRKVLTNLDNIRKQRLYFANKGPSSQGYGFSSGHVWM